MNEPLVCLDFDGVIHSYTSSWIDETFIPDPPVPGAFQWMADALDHFHLCIFSSRSKSPEGIKAMYLYIKHWAPKEVGNAEPKYLGNKLINYFTNTREAWPTMKPPAFLTIDDRGWQFTGTFPTIEEIQSFRPWNKK